eukprot:CAMPEP_0176170136 /NCGR_PEP_ID=MMETSP0120_2-20121206/87106_1 /TAXON_ID=160619 /ORGANISM="Kryptoperidinium foliaceum, Strain CCMP 1326" /LENGTH=326 /DNA_ID=CAMNT_0017507945 /DNA_START=46 /DNA_END=1027 /DNA_ORIENTATION=-
MAGASRAWRLVLDEATLVRCNVDTVKAGVMQVISERAIYYADAVAAHCALSALEGMQSLARAVQDDSLAGLFDLSVLPWLRSALMVDDKLDSLFASGTGVCAGWNDYVLRCSPYAPVLLQVDICMQRIAKAWREVNATLALRDAAVASEPSLTPLRKRLWHWQREDASNSGFGGTGQDWLRPKQERMDKAVSMLRGGGRELLHTVSDDADTSSRASEGEASEVEAVRSEGMSFLPEESRELLLTPGEDRPRNRAGAAVVTPIRKDASSNETSESFSKPTSEEQGASILSTQLDLRSPHMSPRVSLPALAGGRVVAVDVRGEDVAQE